MYINVSIHQRIQSTGPVDAVLQNVQRPGKTSSRDGKFATSVKITKEDGVSTALTDN